MRSTKQGIYTFYFILLIVVITGFSSCRTAREMPVERLKPLSAEELLNFVELNAFDYTDLTIRRIQVQFSNASTKTSFRAQLKALKDEGILVSVSKINIPVGRVLLTPDSLLYVNYMDKNYFVDDYSFLSEFFRFSLDFETIQAILSNQVFFTRQDGHTAAIHSFESGVEDGRYLLQTGGKQSDLNTRGILNRMRSSLYPGRSDRGKQQTGVIQKMYFDRRTYSLERLLIDDEKNNWKLEVGFSDFVKVEKKNYPGTIDMKMTSPLETVDLKIKFNGFSTEAIENVNLNIPHSYSQINMR